VKKEKESSGPISRVLYFNVTRTKSACHLSRP